MAPATSDLTVRDAVLDVLRDRELTPVFANPGSTEVPFLVDLPPDVRFVLGLHEATVVGMASGHALGAGRPALVLLHTTAGLGNAVGALATARVNRAPLVVLVGQQDRRHLAFEPFLAGRLAGLAGDYPVAVHEPTRAQDLPATVQRAWHEATLGRGPVLVVVPMDDWEAPAETNRERAAADRVIGAGAVDGAAVRELADLVGDSRSPSLIVGAGAASDQAWTALTTLAEHLDCPVWQEPFGARPGFPQDHPRFAGHLPAGRGRVREALAGHDLVLAAGAPVLRQYQFEPGPLLPEGAQAAVISDDPAEAHRSPSALTLLGPIGPACAALAELVPARQTRARPAERQPPASPAPPATGEPLRAAHVLDALASRLPADVVLLEEAPSTRPELNERLPARTPLGFVSAAMGGLGFALPAAAGLRMALPDRPVVAVIGDGSSLYSVQALWSAARYGAGALIVVLANGGYRIMDRLAEDAGGTGPWPSFEDVRLADTARSLGCPATRVESHDELTETLDRELPGLARRDHPLLVEAVVAADPTFNP